MKKILTLMLNGDPMPGLLMHVIRFVMPSKSKPLKKLLLIYWEICPKVNPDGKMKQEMILVCNALRNDLQHPNEYIRGMTLRFMCKLKHVELIEPCVPLVRSCLEHRHSYVRKNAVLAIASIHKTAEFLLPDAPELLREFISGESDQNAKRNCLVRLMNINLVLAVEWMLSVWNEIVNFEPIMQLAIIEVIRKDSKSTSFDKAKYIQGILSLLESTSHSVQYEAANTLLALTGHVTAVKAVAKCYINLIIKESDNNIKLIVLDRLKDLIKSNEKIVDDQVMEILRILAWPDHQVRKKCLSIVVEVGSFKNVEEIIGFLKKELQKNELSADYKHLLIQTLHQFAVNYAQVAGSVVHVLLEFIGEQNVASAVDVVSFVRQVMERYPEFRNDLLNRLLGSIDELKSSRVFRGVFWVLGEYADSVERIEESLDKLLTAIGSIPITLDEEEEQIVVQEKQQTSQKVLADGTYATQSVFTSNSAAAETKRSLRKLLLEDFYLASVLASTLTKFALKYSHLQTDKTKANSFRAKVMLVLTSIIRVGITTGKLDEDSHDRILTCLRAVANPSTRDALFFSEKRPQKQSEQPTKKVEKVQVDDPISFRLLKGSVGTGNAADLDSDLVKATGFDTDNLNLVSKLDRVVQLTGFSDPVYAEAYVTVHQYDILLDVLIVNQTQQTLQNLTLEFSTLGDLKLVERPQPKTIGPRGIHSVKANIKVSSTDNGVIFGNIVYEGSSSIDMKCVILNDIHIDIMDYINPASCTEHQFRAMWTEFEWENKVNVSTNIPTLHQYLEHILKCTNMKCLTPVDALSGDCGFLAANLYAKSIFGEDALANLCLEKQGTVITGHVRIRAKTQGIALSLGDKITFTQKITVSD